MPFKVRAEDAHSSLRNLVYNIWSQGNCESHVDIIRMLGAIDFFLPYFPLEASNLRDLFAKRLHTQAEQLQGSDTANLTWSPPVIDFLLSKVQQLACAHNFSLTVVDNYCCQSLTKRQVQHIMLLGVGIMPVSAYMQNSLRLSRISMVSG